MTGLEPQIQLRRIPDQVSCPIDEDTMIMIPATGQYFSLDLVGSQIWNLLEQPHSADDLVKVLIPEYETSAERCLEDTLAFLRQLFQWGLIERVP